MSEHELSDLIRRAQAKDPDAFDELVDRFGPRLFGFLFRLSGSRSEAEDMLQELFLRVVRRIDRYRDVGQFEAWLFRIASNLARDRIRRLQRTPESVPFEDGDQRSESAGVVSRAAGGSWTNDPAESAALREQSDRLNLALERLPEAEREVVMLRHFSHLSFAEIAASMGTPVGTALARAHRGLAKLRAMLQPEA
jgi:RNA polymerase sigma-70 factor (ECF subfamily)